MDREKAEKTAVGGTPAVSKIRQVKYRGVRKREKKGKISGKRNRERKERGLRVDLPGKVML